MLNIELSGRFIDRKESVKSALEQEGGKRGANLWLIVIVDVIIVIIIVIAIIIIIFSIIFVALVIIILNIFFVSRGCIINDHFCSRGNNQLIFSCL